MLRTALVVLLGLAASNASAQRIVRLREAPLPAQSHRVQIDTDRALSVRHRASGETARCEESCVVQMAEGEYSLELHGGLIRPARALPLTLAGPERLTLRVRPRRGLRILGVFIAGVVGLGGLVTAIGSGASSCDGLGCIRDPLVTLTAALVSTVGLTVGIGLMFTRDRVEFTSAAQPAR